jgi:hypothetical protein
LSVSNKAREDGAGEQGRATIERAATSKAKSGENLSRAEQENVRAEQENDRRVNHSVVVLARLSRRVEPPG